MEPVNQGRVPKTTFSVEPVVKVFGGVENVRKKEVEEGPQLVQIILQWRPRQQESVFSA